MAVHKVARNGRIIMITSGMIFGGATSTTYSAAKLTLVGFAKSLAIKGKPHGIFVNTVATSGYSPSTAKAIQSNQIIEEIKAFMPAADITPGVLWLAHEEFEETGRSFAVASRLMTEIFLTETYGFLGSQDADWGIESIREHWSEVTDKTKYTIPTDAAVFGPLLFQRLSAGSSTLWGDELEKGFWKEVNMESCKSSRRGS